MKQLRDYLSNFTLAAKIEGGFAIFSVLLVIVAGVAYFSMSTNRAVVTDVVKEYQPAVLASNQLQKRISTTAASMGFYLLSKEDSHKENYLKGLELLTEDIVALSEFPVIKEDQISVELVDKLHSQIDQYKKYKDQVVLYATKDSENFPAMFYGARNINPLSQEMLQLVTIMIQSEEEEEATPQRKRLVRDLGDLRYAFSGIMGGIRAYLAFRLEASKDEVELYRGQVETVLERLSAYEDVLTFEQEDGLEQFLEIKERFFKNYDELLRVHGGEQWRMDSYVLRSEISPLVDDIIEGANALIHRQKESIDSASHALFKAMDLSNVVIIGASVIAILLVILIAFIIRQISIKPIRQTVAALQDIAEGEGDLTRRLSATGKDEVAQLANAFNLFADRICTLISKSATVASNLSDGVSRLEIVSEQSSKGAKAQLSETTDVNESISTMLLASRAMTHNAKAAANSAIAARGVAENGQKTVDEAGEVFGELVDEVESANKVIKDLESNVNNIGVMLESIKGIAEQTNLLALNAAIEAARAGEQGRGFAVVADEVRTLASRTQDSAAEIDTIVTNFQDNTRIAVDVMTRGQEKAQLGMGYTESMSSSLGEITNSVNTIVGMNELISSETEEQQRVSSVIQENIGTLSEIGEQSAQGSEQTRLTAVELAKFRDQLQSLMQQFKVK